MMLATPKVLLVALNVLSSFLLCNAALVPASPKRVARQALDTAVGTFQVLAKFPQSTPQTTIQCANAMGFTPSDGCVHVPSITNIFGQILFCDLVCPQGNSLLVRQLSFPSSSFPAIDPNGLPGGNFQVTDNSNSDTLFVGDSFGIVTQATTTTTTATASSSLEAGPTTVAASTKRTLPPAKGNIASCVCTKGPPETGSTYGGTGSGGSTLTCNTIPSYCAGPFAQNPCPDDDDNAQNCINKFTTAPINCSFSGLGSGKPSTGDLTCPTVCVSDCP